MITRDSIATVHVVHSHGEADQLLDATTAVGHVELYGTFFREPGAGAVFTADEVWLANLQAASPIGRSPGEAITALFAALGLTRSKVAIDLDGVDRSLECEIRIRLPRVDFRDGSDFLRKVRSIKSGSEIRALALAARSLEGSIGLAAAAISPGISERDLATVVEQSLIASGARPALTMLKVGREAVFGQRKQRPDVVVQHNDIVWFDCDAVKNKYWADIARVFVVGESERPKSIFEALLAGQAEGIERIRPGMTGADAFHIVMNAVHKAGLPSYRRHHVGHGIGLEPYERPLLSPASLDVIEAGMVISVETPFYEYGLGALHVEDPILVGLDGNRPLTSGKGTIGYALGEVA